MDQMLTEYLTRSNEKKGEWKASDELRPDHPFSEQGNKKAMAKALTVNFDDKLWETEEIQPSEVPEELKESGAINVSLRDVKIV